MVLQLKFLHLSASDESQWVSLLTGTQAGGGLVGRLQLSLLYDDGTPAASVPMARGYQPHMRMVPFHCFKTTEDKLSDNQLAVVIQNGRFTQKEDEETTKLSDFFRVSRNDTTSFDRGNICIHLKVATTHTSKQHGGRRFRFSALASFGPSMDSMGPAMTGQSIEFMLLAKPPTMDATKFNRSALQEVPTGTRFNKHFAGLGTFEGRVEEYNQKEGTYRVVYDADDTFEDIKTKAMLQLVALDQDGKKAASGTKRKLSGEPCRDFKCEQCGMGFEECTGRKASPKKQKRNEESHRSFEEDEDEESEGLNDIERVLLHLKSTRLCKQKQKDSVRLSVDLLLAHSIACRYHSVAMSLRI